MAKEREDVELGLDYEHLETSLGKAQAMFEDFGKEVETTAHDAQSVWEEAATAIVASAIVVSHAWDKTMRLIGDLWDAFSSMVRKGVDDAMDYQSAVARLTSGIKAFGGASGLSIENMEQINKALQGLSVYGEDAIRSAQQALLQFRNVRGDVFVSAIKSAMDFAAVTGGSLSDAASHLGSRLEDPIEGLKELAAQGAKFSDADKKMLGQMLRTNDVLGLQHMYLNKLGTLYGGAASRQANTWAGAQQKLSNVMTSMFARVGSLFVPTLANKLIPVMQKVAKVVDMLVTKFTSNDDFFGDAFDKGLVYAEKLFDYLSDKGVKAFSYVQTALENWDSYWALVWNQAQIVAIEALLKTIDGVKWLAGEAMNVMQPYFDWLSAKWLQIGDAARAGWDLVMATAAPVIDFFVSMWDGLVSLAVTAWDEIGKPVLDWVAFSVGAAFVFYHFMTELWDTVTTVTKVTWELLKSIVDTATTSWQMSLTVAAGAFYGIWKALGLVFDAYIASVGAGFEGIKEIARQTFGPMLDLAGVFFEGAIAYVKQWATVFGAAWDLILSGASAVFGKIFDYLKKLGFTLMDNLGGDIKAAMQPALDAMDKAGDAFNDAKAKAGAAADAIKKKFADAFPGVDVDLDGMKDKLKALGQEDPFQDFGDKLDDELKDNKDKLLDFRSDLIDTMNAPGADLNFGQPGNPFDMKSRDRDHDKHGSGGGSPFDDLLALNKRIQGAALTGEERAIKDQTSALLTQGRELIDVVKQATPKSHAAKKDVRLFSDGSGFAGGGL